jgi:hypothetical protein
VVVIFDRQNGKKTGITLNLFLEADLSGSNPSGNEFQNPAGNVFQKR